MTADPNAGQAFRLQAWGEFTMLGLVVPYLTQDGLTTAREWLRHPAQREVSMGTPSLRALWVNLLDGVCRRLVTDFGQPADYFIGVGDMLPEADDDLSQLERLDREAGGSDTPPAG